MLGYFRKRIFQSFFLLLGVLSITFLIIHLAPGEPIDIYVTPEIDPAVVENIRTRLGLDKPIYVQFWSWLWRFVQGDFGMSLARHQPVVTIFKEALPPTLGLTIPALGLDLILGITIGIISAAKKYSVLDHALSFGTLFIYSMPGFWLALMLILIFSLKLGWLPCSQVTSFDSENLNLFHRLLDYGKHLIMPVIVLGLASAASTARFVRSNILEVLNQDFIRTARAKGLTEITILWKHALRNSLISVITLFGLSFPFLLGGAVVTEYVFAWPGMGRITVESIFARDYPVILATNFLAALMVILGNLIADVLYAIVDPRIKYS
ncbi:MAG: ABC transporter permease [candidate division KSB1 bacterium]|nr:ABC transporter permease [candidate division KSB1 bacterium]